jgi:YHYH protein/Putative Ig domain
MAAPTWTLPSNTLLATLQERISTSITLGVYDAEDRSTTETNQFVGLDHYSTAFYFYIRSNGLAKTPWLGEPANFNTYSPVAHSYVFKIPRNISAMDYNDVFPNVPTTDVIGVAIDGVPIRSPNSGRIALIKNTPYTENNVIYPAQAGAVYDSTLPFTDGSGVIGPDQKFYYQTNPHKLNARHTDGHSKIIGYALDGFPIYGPYGYSQPYDIHSSVRIMESSYRLRDQWRSNNTVPDGSYIEDFIYEDRLGDLDQYNGRECITPDYPEGIYAYFATVDVDNQYLPVYPYLVGPKYRFNPELPNSDLPFPGDITVDLISGQLPPGLYIDGKNIKGTPYEVAQKTQSRFVLRASNEDGITDRTFSIIVEGPSLPQWITPAGDLEVGTIGESTKTVKNQLRAAAHINDTTLKLLSVFGIKAGSSINFINYNSSLQSGTTVTGINLISRTVSLSKSLINTIPINAVVTFSYTETRTNLFVLDNAQVDYQLSAIDSDTAAGQVVTYYIPPKGGVLPPGLSLTEDGRIVGFTDAILSNIIITDQGFYDQGIYDGHPYDFGEKASNGYDDFFYDSRVFDYSDPVTTPKKLNRYYEFVVRAICGVYYTDRKFRIFVVGDDYFRADDTVIHAANTMFSVDATYLRSPIWLTPSYLGKKRANNYVTLLLSVFDPNTLLGSIGYILETTNPDGTVSALPPGMQLDQLSGNIYGSIPYQPAITETYEFTIKAIRYDPTSSTFAVRHTTTVAANINQNIIQLDSVNGILEGSLVESATGTQYISPGTIVKRIVSTTFKQIELSKGLAISAPVRTDLIFTFVTSTNKTFSLDIIGEIESTIRFTTDGDLSSIDANFVSTISLEAISTIPSAVLTYTVIGGNIPPGLSLIPDGTIQGKVTQFSDSVLYKGFWQINKNYSVNDLVRVNNLYYKCLFGHTSGNNFSIGSNWILYIFDNSTNGLTTIDANKTSFDGHSTSIGRSFIFTVEAKDQFNLSAVTKTFKLSVNTPNNLLYSNIYVKPFMKQEKRLTVSNFLTDPSIFTREKLFRPGDAEFGVQTDLKMLLYPGIETKYAADYANAFGRSYRKKFRLGDIKKAVAKIPGTNIPLYEVIYIAIIDDMEKDITGLTQTYINSLPVNIRVKNNSYNNLVNQGRRDPIDSDITDDNIAVMNRDELQRIMLQDRVLSADYSAQTIGNTDKIIFGNSVTNIRNNIKAIGDTERNYLPLWMRTPQTLSGVQQGFTKAITICYCLPGEADYIMLNIEHSGFDFKQIDFTVDRVIIDSVTGESGDKYIAFAAREVING